MPKPYQDARDAEEDLRARLESAEAGRNKLMAAIKGEIMVRPIPRRIRETYDELAAALAEVGQERQHLVCSACGRSSDTEPRGGLCGMPRPPLGICCGRFRAALSTTGETESRSDG